MRTALVGAGGLPAHYGGSETAVEEIGRRLAERDHDGWVHPPGDLLALARVMEGLSRLLVEKVGENARALNEVRYMLGRHVDDWRAVVRLDSGTLTTRRPGAGT